VPYRAEPHTGGRHRQETVRRRRSLPFIVTLPFTLDLPSLSDRGRNAVVTAALAAALVTGVAGGAAAAADERKSHPAPPQLSSVAEFGSGDEYVPGDPLLAADAVAPPAGDVSAQTALLKKRPKPVAVKTTVTTASEKPATAAWVNPNPHGVVTSCYGQRWGRMHAGVDIAGPNGTPILAAGAGVVVRAGEAAGYGNAVLIDHGNGFLTHYGHMSRIAVRAGEHVAVGQQIGDEGSTGHSTGPHLHFEVHVGSYKNPTEPTRWLREHGVQLRGC
jgi:murein DD-endopeptidase MepM/ murein hydrolase activator NlpD